MAQKVITVTGYCDTDNTQFKELEFPKVTSALAEGYFVKEIRPIPLPEAGNSNWFVITFILQKNESVY